MKRKDILTVIIATVAVLLAIALSVTLTYRIAVEPVNRQIAQLNEAIVQVQLKQGEQGVKGDTPVLGKDYKVVDGKTPPCYYEENQCRGQNAVSEKTTETIIREVIKSDPLVAFQTNPYTGDFEVRLSTDTLFQTLIPCEKFVNGCFNRPPVVIEPLPGIGEL